MKQYPKDVSLFQGWDQDPETYPLQSIENLYIYTPTQTLKLFSVGSLSL